LIFNLSITDKSTVLHILNVKVSTTDQGLGHYCDSINASIMLNLCCLVTTTMMTTTAILKTLFIMLSLWQNHCENSLECWTAPSSYRPSGGINWLGHAFAIVYT